MKKQFFEDNGYYIEKKLFSLDEMNNMFLPFYDVFLCLSGKFSVPLRKKYKSSNEEILISI